MQSGKSTFLADRMLGPLTRHLRMMGYDCASALSRAPGDSREDTALLDISRSEGRILLTRDRELARRGGVFSMFMQSEDPSDQMCQLVKEGLVLLPDKIGMHRCPLCNTVLRPATRKEITMTSYAPSSESGSNLSFAWCPSCRKLYWPGSHGENLLARLRKRCSRQ